MTIKKLETILEENLKKLKQHHRLKDLNLERVKLQPFTPRFPANGLHSRLPCEPGLLLALHYLKSGSNVPPRALYSHREATEEYLGNPLEFDRLVQCSKEVYHLSGGGDVWAPLPSSVSRPLLAKLASACPPSTPLWLLADQLHLLAAGPHNSRISLRDSGLVEAKPVPLESLKNDLASHFLQPPKVEDLCCSAYLLDRLRLQCTWTGAKSVLEFPQLRGSAKLVVDSDTLKQPLLSSLYQELRLLQSLELAVKDGSPVAWPDNKGLAQQRVTEALEKLAKFSSSKSPHQVNSSLDSCLEEVLLGRQWELDFTDHLWNLLKDCSSNEELLLCLFLVMKKIHYGDVRPLVSSSNGTQLGRWILQVVSHGDQTQVLECPDAGKALEMVLEMGMLKVKRNLASTYCSLELASQHMLEPYLSAGTLTALVTAATILELAVCCLKLLGLPQDTVARITRQHISAWTSKIPDLPFTIDIPMAAVHSVLKDQLPEEWSVKLWSVDHAGFTRELVYMLSKSYFWKSLGFPYPQPSAHDASCYYSLTAHCIQDPNMPPPLAQ